MIFLMSWFIFAQKLKKRRPILSYSEKIVYLCSVHFDKSKTKAIITRVVASLKIIDKFNQKIIRKTGRYFDFGHSSFDNFFNQFSYNFERSDP